MEKRYYHQFQTIDYRAAVEFYKANKFTLWQEENGEDREGDQAHGESREQGEADIDVRDQRHSENDARHENDVTKDNDNREEHVKSN